MEVIKYAGKRKAVLAGIIKTMEQLKPAYISGYAPWFDDKMIKALEECRITTKTSNYPCTMRIINL